MRIEVFHFPKPPKNSYDPQKYKWPKERLFRRFPWWTTKSKCQHARRIFRDTYIVYGTFIPAEWLAPYAEHPTTKDAKVYSQWTFGKLISFFPKSLSFGPALTKEQEEMLIKNTTTQLVNKPRKLDPFYAR